VLPLKYCNELIKCGLESMLCWSLQETIDGLVSTLRKILSSAHPSYTKILAPLITYITEIRRAFCTLRSLLREKITTKLSHSLPSICEIEIYRKNIVRPRFSELRLTGISRWKCENQFLMHNEYNSWQNLQVVVRSLAQFFFAFSLIPNAY